MIPPPSKSSSNHDTGLLAVYLLGGESDPIDTEVEEDFAGVVNVHVGVHHHEGFGEHHLP